MRATLTGALIAGLLGSLSACYAVEDIDRTQPNKVLKSIFNDGGEWLYRQTIIDVPGRSGVRARGSLEIGEPAIRQNNSICRASDSCSPGHG